MKKSKTFTDLIVWEKSHELVLRIYKLSSTFPKSEQFALTSQLRRAVVSIPANIVEGFIKRGIKDKVRYFNISQGSLEEVKYYLILSKDLGYIKSIETKPLIDEVGKLLNSYIKSTLASNF